MASHRVHKEVDAWEWIAVLWVCFIQVGEVYAHSLLSICFFDHNYVGQPFGVVDFLDEVCL